MKVYDALLAAADHIEQNPELYYFDSSEMPSQNGRGRGCMLAWIGELAQPGRFLGADAVAPYFMGVQPRAFFVEIAEICHGMKFDDIDCQESRRFVCLRDPVQVARAMRIYAERHFKDADPLPPIPASIMRIFQPVVTFETYGNMFKAPVFDMALLGTMPPPIPKEVYDNAVI